MYDGMAFPKAPQILSYEWGKTKLSEFWTSESSKTKLNRKEAQENSLSFFLTEHRSTLLKFASFAASDFNFAKLVDDIYHIYQQLCNQKTCNYKNHKELYTSPWASPTLTNVS